MSIDDNRTDDIDWSLTTWEGARREQTRRWAQMPLADMILALEKCRCLQSDFRNRLKQACPPLARYNVAGLACPPLRAGETFPQERLACPLSSPVARNSRFARQEDRHLFEQAVELPSYEPITFAGLLLQSRLIEYLYASAAVGN